MHPLALTADERAKLANTGLIVPPQTMTPEDRRAQQIARMVKAARNRWAIRRLEKLHSKTP